MKDNPEIGAQRAANEWKMACIEIVDKIVYNIQCNPKVWDHIGHLGFKIEFKLGNKKKGFFKNLKQRNITLLEIKVLQDAKKKTCYV